VVNVLITSALQKAQSSGGNVELSDIVLFDDVPVAGEVRIGGSTFKNDGGTTKKQWGVNHVGVTSDPADITTAEVTVVIVDIEDIFASHGGTQQVSGGCVHNTLGLSGRARGVQEEQRVFGVDRLGSKVVGILLNLLVPPDITALGPRDLRASALVDQAGGHIGALLQSLVDNSLGTNDLATTLTLIGSDDNLGVRVEQAVTEGVGGETGKNDGVDGTNTRASKECNDSLGNHGQVNTNGITLLDTTLLQSPSHTGDFPQQLAICDGAALVGLVGLVDDGDLIRVLQSVTIDTVERSVQLTLDEPGIIAIGQRAVVGGLEIFVESEHLTGHTSPESVGTADGLLVELLVLIEVLNVSACGVLVVESFGNVESVDLVGFEHLSIACEQRSWWVGGAKDGTKRRQWDGRVQWNLPQRACGRPTYCELRSSIVRDDIYGEEREREREKGSAQTNLFGGQWKVSVGEKKRKRANDDSIAEVGGEPLKILRSHSPSLKAKF